jgi:hypothetical protein
MTARVCQISQTLIAVMVAAGLIFVEVVSYGPDIDGRTPSMADTIQTFAIEFAIILASSLSAIALFRWKKLGWWSSVVLDGVLSVTAASMIVGDFNDRYMATQEGRAAFRDDLAIHGAILLLCAGATAFLLLARTQFLASNEK